jgi:hypothetical protein
MITSKLRERLQELSPELTSRLQLVQAKAGQLLEYSQAGAHMAYTPHGLSHISAVEANYDWLLADTDFAEFNGSEIFCLLCATFFHDSMMIPIKMGQEADARRNHTEAAGAFLIKNRDLIGLSLHEADVIGDVIRGHGLNDLSQVSSQVVIGSEIVDARKLSACLSLADITHADSSRAPEIVFRHLEFDEDSSYHWRRHLQISGITRKGESLLMSALVFSDDGKAAVQEYRTAIETELGVVRPYFDTVLQPLKRVELSVKRLESPLDQTLRFQTNTPGVLKVLIEGVYDREDVFVRELVQNSLDACLVRRLKLERRNMEYAPQVLVTFFKEGKRVRAVRVDDNGVGMDLNDVRDTVLWIGTTIADKSDIADLVQQAAGKNLIATFGIGLLSCFKASRRISLRTAKEGGIPLGFELTSVSDAVRPEKSSDLGIGTTIVVEIQEGGIEIDPWLTVHHYFKLVRQVDLRLMELEWSANLEGYTRENLSKIGLTQARPIDPVTFVPSTSAVNVQIQGNDYSGALWLRQQDVQTLIDVEGSIQILNEGVFVATEDASYWLDDHLSFLSGYINFSARSLNLPAGRDRVIKDDKFRTKAAEVRGGAFRIIDALVEQSKRGGETRRQAAVILAYIYRLANEEARDKILRSIDEFRVEIYKSQGMISLGEIRRSTRDTLYLHYSRGPWVEDLVKFDEKQLYHKQDDLTDLQAALMLQEGQLVVSATRNQSAQKEEELLEAAVLQGFFTKTSIAAIDLSKTNIVEGKYRSKPVPQALRQRILKSVKFVDIAEMPNKMSWRVGTEVWINTAHPVVSRAYLRLLEQPKAEQINDLVEILVNLLSYDLENTFRNLSNLIEHT